MKQGFEIIDQRKARRFDGRLGIVAPDDEGLNFGVLTNLSRSGAYVEFQKPKPLGASFSFLISNGFRQELMQGEVVRLDTSLFHHRPSGFGLHFTDLSISAKRLRDDLLMFLMLRSYSAFNQNS